ncbi:hypothetical protein L1987_74906 [Smallanthus sonchifolius]|uniref:Uncharacterized protein n=1 Tax=Smallanthus sonchifolius TaxID=185202 RepID=A0ACB9A4V5_9ASTR|nr:hypothetical protein L1987_74906 [Smallanthus sonchifolius]
MSRSLVLVQGYEPPAIHRPPRISGGPWWFWGESSHFLGLHTTTASVSRVVISCDRVVLVGHSYGGLAISLAMERFPHIVSVAVFVTAYMPNCRDPPAVLMTKVYYTYLLIFLLEEFEAGIVYGLPVHIRKWIADISRTRRQFHGHHDVPELSTGEDQDVVNVDRMRRSVMKEEFQRFVIEDSPPNEIKTFPGAGHMIMLSKSKDISFYLQEIATRYM